MKLSLECQTKEKNTNNRWGECLLYIKVKSLINWNNNPQFQQICSHAVRFHWQQLHYHWFICYLWECSYVLRQQAIQWHACNIIIIITTACAYSSILHTTPYMSKSNAGFTMHDFWWAKFINFSTYQPLMLKKNAKGSETTNGIVCVGEYALKRKEFYWLTETQSLTAGKLGRARGKLSAPLSHH